MSLLILVAAIPIGVTLVRRASTFQAQGSDFSLVPYPNVTWSETKPYTISVLINPQTPDETIVISQGQAVAGQTEANVSNEVYFFYDKLLTSKNFTQIKVTGDPTSDNTWVATYQLGENVCEIQYYPTPYASGTYTILVFLGSITSNETN